MPLTACFLARAAMVIAAAILAMPMAHAQKYPSKPITLYVPFTAGGGSDLLARSVTQRVGERIGQTFVIENRPGAGTTIAANAVARAAADGYTLMQGTSSTMAINVSMFKSLAYQPLEDLVPVAFVARSPFFLVVNPSSPVKSVKDLIALAKEKPKGLNFGSGGLGSMHHLSTELLMSLTGTEMTHVMYKGTPPALLDLLAGRLDVLFGDATTTLPQIRQGRVRALGVTTAKRSPAAPDVPTVEEAGVPGFETASWHMIVAPKGTPPEIIALLNREVREVFKDEKLVKELTERGVGPVVTGPPQELEAFVKNEIKRWSEINKRAGIAGTL